MDAVRHVGSVLLLQTQVGTTGDDGGVREDLNTDH